MSYNELANHFKYSFPEGRFGSTHYVGGNIVAFRDLKMGADASTIAKATVCYNQEGKTVIIDEDTDEVFYVVPLTAREYAARN